MSMLQSTPAEEGAVGRDVQDVHGIAYASHLNEQKRNCLRDLVDVEICAKNTVEALNGKQIHRGTSHSTNH